MNIVMASVILKRFVKKHGFQEFLNQPSTDAFESLVIAAEDEKDEEVLHVLEWVSDQNFFNVFFTDSCQ